MTLKKTTIALALTLFMVLAGTGVGNAFWSAQATTTSGVSAGAIGISQSGFESLQMTYTATALVATAPITVTNTGTVPAPYTLTLAAQTANALASGAQVRTWAVGAAGECTASAAIPPGATDTNWTNIPALTGTLAPAGQKIHCVRTSLTSLQQTSLAATSMVGTLNLVSVLGSWSASVTAVSPTHTVTDTAAPSVPGAPIASATTNTQTTLTWAASTDNVGVSAYDVYRGGVLITTVTSPTFTNTGLTPATSYGYTIRARDAAGNVSAASGLTAVMTAATGDTASPSTPGRPVASATTGVQTTLTWAASTDNAGVTGYEVYRGGVLIATVTSTNFTDTGLNAGTTYSYSITAKDAAGNLSPASPAASVTTLGLASSIGYKIKPANGTGLCLDGSKEPPVHGTTLVTATCNGNSQPWNAVSVGGYYKVVHPTKAFVWAITDSSLIDGAGARLETDLGAVNQQWEIVVESPGLYHLVSRASGKCLEAPGASAVLGAQLQQNTCNGSAAQSFTLVP